MGADDRRVNKQLCCTSSSSVIPAEGEPPFRALEPRAEMADNLNALKDPDPPKK